MHVVTGWGLLLLHGLAISAHYLFFDMAEFSVGVVKLYCTRMLAAYKQVMAVWITGRDQRLVALSPQTNDMGNLMVVF